MTMILRPTSRRRFAAAMLFVWIFALAAGIANACAPGQAHGGAVPLAVAEHHHDEASNEQRHAGAPLGDVVPSPGAPDAACQKFCDDERSTLNLPIKDLGSAADMLPVLLLQPTTLAWTSGDDRAVESPNAPVPVRETGPPIPIRFLRLTI